ncbi:lysophospholipid acyltransferase family protein [Hydrogenovibrio sp. SC-1]|uniref:lysophospholipid acyltransferase family protein n=1 Tax=Hydrogenovibrio sp. SC-1 TaxID=2065820 RepID=UPI0013041645|nr:lysophospholipid acyltransferase family protein [Hydrogenovibrio sp. SC-1]
MNNSSPFQIKYLKLQYWGIWIGFGLLRLIGWLPYRPKMAVGKVIGRLLYYIAPSRKRIAHHNLQNCFPEKTANEISQLTKQHFESLGISLAETTMNFWGRYRKHPNNNERQYFHFHGLEHFYTIKNRGILLVVPHFTTMETTGLMLTYITDFRPIYRPHDNPLMETLITQSRTIANTPDPKQYSSIPISNKDTKGIVRALRNNQVIWIAPDQRYRAKGKINVPFFNMDAPSNPGICKLAKRTNAAIIPVFTRRIGLDYHLTFLPPLDNFPSGDDYQDIQKLHQLYEVEITENPSQYLWTHNRWNIKF